MVIDGDMRTQKSVSLRQSDVIDFDLKVGDRVIYGGKPYTQVFVFKKL
jgi:hypothetical protein